MGKVWEMLSWCPQLDRDIQPLEDNYWHWSFSLPNTRQALSPALLASWGLCLISRELQGWAHYSGLFFSLPARPLFGRGYPLMYKWPFITQNARVPSATWILRFHLHSLITHCVPGLFTFNYPAKTFYSLHLLLCVSSFVVTLQGSATNEWPGISPKDLAITTESGCR